VLFWPRRITFNGGDNLKTVKVLVGLTVLVASAAWADETTERGRDRRAQYLRATLNISHEPMGEATLHLPPTYSIPLKRFVTRSVAFISPDTSVVVATHEQQFEPASSKRVPVLFALRREGSEWHIASFRVLAEASPKNVP
jgi:hypothetical protein